MERFSYGVLLRKYRLAAHITQAQLAGSLGERQSFISKLESGEQRVDLDALKRICDALHIDIVNFVREYFAS